MFEHHELDFKELSSIVDLKTGTLTPILQKLVKIGYITKTKNDNDARRVTIALTNKGHKLNEQIIEVPLHLASKLEISEDMYKVLVKELDNLSMILKNASIKKEITNE
jgi:DNA-binding MarR family transcriptional regulator